MHDECLSEAMKIETTVPSPVTGTVTEIVAGAGAQVETRDLVVSVEPKDQ